MKKNAFIQPVLVAALLIITSVLSSCKKDFLEIVPKGKLIAKTTADYEKALVSLDVLNINTDAQVVLGDEVAAVEPFFSGAALRTQRLYRWEGNIYDQGQNGVEMTVPMQNIYLYNKIINEVMASADGSETQKATIRAMAQAGRAWTYFLLINYFGKPYLESTASNAPGFPIITEADVTENGFTRASVKEVYDFIVKDLTEAIPHLPVQITHRMRLSKTAGEAILGKVYMFMGKFEAALQPLNDAFTDMSNPAIPVRLYDYRSTFATGGAFLPVGLFGPAYPTTVNIEENILAKQTINNWAFSSNEIVLANTAKSLYTSTDLRLNWYTGNAYPSGALPSGLLRKRGPISIQFGMTVPDLYLLRAETKARLNDLPGAVADLEALRVKRIAAKDAQGNTVNDAEVPPAIATDQNQLIRFIFEERIREFALQGYRWFDMRRLSVDPQFSNTVGATHTLYAANGTVSATFNLAPERFTLRFAPRIMELNPNMSNNP